MNSEENSKKRNDFKTFLREQLIPHMESENYSLSYDNDLLDDEDRESWVFKLEFQGPKTVEVSNDDWRDYTEYFNFYVDSELIFTINVLQHADANEAYESCIRNLQEHLHK